MTINQQWECECGWTGHDDDLRSECTFAGNQEEPPEYEGYCPDCGGNADKMYQLAMCKSCDDVQVKDDGDICGECRECMLEDRADGLRDEGFGISVADAIVNNWAETERAMVAMFGPDYQEQMK